MIFRTIRRRKNRDIFLELTPLIDVVFLLLIFFMVSTTFVDVSTGINIKLPQSTVQEVVANREVIVSVTESKAVYVQERAVRFENLEDEISKALQAVNKTNVIIKGDNDLDYGFIVKVMTACKNAGATQLDIATDIQE